MANHLHLAPETLPTPDKLETVVKEFLAAKFPKLKLVTPCLNETAWSLYYPNGVAAIGLFWLEEASVEEEEDGEIYEFEATIVFRVAYGYQFSYWVVTELMYYLQANGYGSPPEWAEIPELNTYTSYQDYLSIFRSEAYRLEEVTNNLEWFPELKDVIYEPNKPS